MRNNIENKVIKHRTDGYTMRNIAFIISKFLKEVTDVPATYLDSIKGKGRVDGFIMKNESNDVTVKCTVAFVKAWKDRGFMVVEERPIILID